MSPDTMGTAEVIRANARDLPLADDSVDLVVTSPPYFALRSYTDDGAHYAGQIGDEATPAEFVDALLEVTRECMRVLKPSGSLWVNLGDKYAGGGVMAPNLPPNAGPKDAVRRFAQVQPRTGIATKSLIGIPWRYALRCIDDLGLILRAEVIWSKPNGLPESVTDRVRRSHEQWFHFVMRPRYFSAVDEIREAHVHAEHMARYSERAKDYDFKRNNDRGDKGATILPGNPLGKLPGSVWTIPTEPLRVPDHLGVDHFAAFPTEWPKRIIRGWSPAGVCVECGEGRRPVVDVAYTTVGAIRSNNNATTHRSAENGGKGSSLATITDYACACLEPTADTTPGVVLDCFGGTGTTAMVAKALGRHGITVDMSADYCRLARWRTNDRDQLAKVLDIAKADQEPTDTPSLFDLTDGGAA